MSNLVKKTIIDVNGVRKNVNVRGPIATAKSAPRRNLDNVPLNTVSQAERNVARNIENLPVPSAQELKNISNADTDRKIIYARRFMIAREVLELLGTDKNPEVRNNVTTNKRATARALSNVVDRETGFRFLSKEDQEFQAENLVNVALHPNSDTPTLRRVSKLKRNNAQGREIAIKRLRGDDYIPRGVVNKMVTRSLKTGFFLENGKHEEVIAPE